MAKTSAAGASGAGKEGKSSYSELLRAAGLRRTGPRVAVLERLALTETPVSHGELFDGLSGTGYDRATIYRNLIDLTEAGLVARSDLGDHVWRFELKGEDGGEHAKKHPHLVCTDCGEVSCLPDVQVQIRGGRGSKRSFKPSELEIQLKGKCQRCEP
jgi:Fur family ferric uptake transcriptional regulator